MPSRGLHIPSILDLNGLRTGVREAKTVAARGGTETAKEFLNRQRTEFFRQRAVIKEAQVRNFITKEEARKRGREVGRDFNAAITGELDKLRRAGKTGTAEFQLLQRSLKSVGTTATDTTRRWNPLSAAISASVRKLQLWVAVAGTLIAIRIGRFLRESTAEFRKFDAALTQSLAIMGDVPAVFVEQMKAVAGSLSRELNLPISQVGEGFYFLASAGLDAQQSIAAIPTVARFAKAGMFDLATATDLATDAQSALGLKAKDNVENLRNLTRVTDVLVKAGNLSNATVQQFSEALTNKSAAAIRSLGKDVEEGTAVLAAFADQGVKGADAGTQLNIVLRDLQTRAIQGGEAFRKLVFDDGEVRNFADIIGDLEKALAGMSDETKKATLLQLGFSDKSLASLLVLLGTSDAIREYEAELRKAGGTTQEVANKQLRAQDEELGRVAQKWNGVKRAVGAFLVLNVQRPLAEIADALIRTERPLERTIELLNQLGPETTGLFELNQQLIETRETVRKLQDESEKATINRTVGFFAPGSAGGVSRTPVGQLPTPEIERLRDSALAEIDDLQQQLDAAIEANDARETRRLKQKIKDLSEEGRQYEAILTTRRDLVRATEVLTDVERRLAEQRARSNIETRIREIDRLIAAEERGAGSLNRIIELQERRDALAVKLESTKPSAGSTTGEEDPFGLSNTEDAAKRAREQLEQMVAVFRELQSFSSRAGVLPDAIPEEATAQLRRVVELRQQIEQLRDLAKTAGGFGEGGAEFLASLETELARLEAQLGPTADRFKDLLSTAAPAIATVAQLGASVVRTTLDTIEPQSVALQQAIEAVRSAESELTRAVIAGDQAQAESARKALEARRDTLRQVAATFARTLEDVGLPAETVRALVDQLAKALQQAGVEAEGVGEKAAEGFDRTARSIEVALRGLLSILDAIGNIDDQTRRAVTGLADIAAGVGQISAGGPAGIVSGITAILGGLAGIGKAAFGGETEEERRARQEQIRQIERATEELGALADEIGPLASAIERARDALVSIAEQVGLADVRSVADVQTRRAEIGQSITAIRGRLAQGGLSDAAREGLEATLAQLELAFEQLGDALSAFDDQAEKVRQSFLDDLDLKTLELTATQDVIDARKLEIEQAKALADAQAALEAGFITEDDLQKLRDFQDLQRRVAEQRRAAAEQRSIEDSRVAKLEAEGRSRTAAVQRLLLEQERELAELRERGASAAEIAAKEEEQAAKRREQRLALEKEAAQIELDLLERAARRSGDPAALQRVTEARLAIDFRETQDALDDLRDAGILTADEFTSLSDLLRDDFSAAVEEAAAAARKAADDFELSIEDSLAGLTLGTEDDQAVARKRAQLRAEEDRKAAREFFAGDPARLQRVLEKIDDRLALELSNIESGATALEPAGATGGTIDRANVATLQGLSQAVGLSFVSLQRQTWEEAKLIRVAAVDGAASLRRLVGSNAARFQPPPIPSGAAGGVFIQNLIGRLQLELPNVTRFDVATAPATAREFIRYAYPEILKRLNTDLGRLANFQYRGTGAQGR